MNAQNTNEIKVIALYEDNAGGLTISDGSRAYNRLETLEDVGGFVDDAREFALEGELDHYREDSVDPAEIDCRDNLVATYCAGHVMVTALAGVAACRYLDIA